MIEQQGRVVSGSGQRVRVRLGGTAGCAACDAGRGCGAGVFGRLLKRRPVELDFDNTIDARPGQAVRVGLSESLFLSLVLRFYLAPLLAGLAGAVIGHVAARQAGLGAAGVDLAALGGALLAAAVMLRRRGVREFSSAGAVQLLDIVHPSNDEHR